MEWMLLPLKRYFEFSGRSRRMEYWMFVLFQFLIWIAFAIIAMVILGGAGLMAGASDEGSGGMVGALLSFGVVGVITLLVYLALLVPALAVVVRQLHDTNRSGKWLLLVIAPYALGYVLAVIGLGSESTALAAAGGLLTLVGAIAGLVLFVFMFLPGTVGPNRYGPDPKAAEHGAATTPTTY